MDCIIVGHAVKPFIAALACLTRIGKEITVDFDPMDGLSLRSLNDSKSIFSSFHFEPSYFQKCSSPPFTSSKKKRRKTQTESHFTIRISIKALVPLIRPRKDVLSLQIVTVGDLLSFEYQMQRLWHQNYCLQMEGFQSHLCPRFRNALCTDSTNSLPWFDERRCVFGMRSV